MKDFFRDRQLDKTVKFFLAWNNKKWNFFARAESTKYWPFRFIQNWKKKKQKISFLILLWNHQNQKKEKKKTQKISNTVIRKSLEQYRNKEIAWLISNFADALKLFCFVEIQSFNGVIIVSKVINWPADVNGRSLIVGLKYKNLIFIELFFQTCKSSPMLFQFSSFSCQIPDWRPPPFPKSFPPISSSDWFSKPTRLCIEIRLKKVKIFKK